MDIFNEILWPQFKKLNHIRKLPLNEQVNKYNQYLYELTEARMSWIAYQNKGGRGTVVDIDTFFILQEDDSYVLQEDGDKLIWN